nr:MAG TPA: hypothetical protein [Caudoviricetes sp.]
MFIVNSQVTPNSFSIDLAIRQYSGIRSFLILTVVPSVLVKNTEQPSSSASSSMNLSCIS